MLPPPLIGVIILVAVIVVAVVAKNRSPSPPVCSIPCTAPQICQADGSCAVPPPPPGSCTDDTQCVFPKVCLSGLCSVRPPPPQSTCSPSCVPPQTCQAGNTCALPCTPVPCTGQYICRNNTCVSPNMPLSRCTDQQEAQFYRVQNAGSGLNPGACTITEDGKLHFVNAYAEQNGQIEFQGLSAASCQAKCDSLGEPGCVGWATNNGANGVNNCRIFPSDIPRSIQGDPNWSVDVSARVVNTPHQ
jgi:hypothetical protein